MCKRRTGGRWSWQSLGLELKNVNLGGHRHLVIDVAVSHKFGGDHLAGVSRNGALCDAQPGRILESTARTKVER